jgi:hypothetical protein
MFHQCDRNRLTRNKEEIPRIVCLLLVRANFAPSSPILVTLMTRALSSSETSALAGATRRNIPEEAIFGEKLHFCMHSAFTIGPEVFTALIMKGCLFRDTRLCMTCVVLWKWHVYVFCEVRRFGVTCRFCFQGRI